MTSVSNRSFALSLQPQPRQPRLLSVKQDISPGGLLGLWPEQRSRNVWRTPLSPWLGGPDSCARHPDPPPTQLSLWALGPAPGLQVLRVPVERG